MEIEQLMPHTEALIFASERPLTPIELTTFLSQALEEIIETDRVSACLEAIFDKYSAPFYAFELRETGGGYQFPHQEGIPQKQCCS